MGTAGRDGRGFWTGPMVSGARSGSPKPCAGRPVGLLPFEFVDDLPGASWGGDGIRVVLAGKVVADDQGIAADLVDPLQAAAEGARGRVVMIDVDPFPGAVEGDLVRVPVLLSVEAD